jgi:hypothetical protein
MKFGPKEIKELNEYLRTGRNRKREFLGGGITFASDLAKPVDKFEVQQIDLFNQFNKRNPRADGGRIKLQGGTDIRTRQGFQPGNPGNIQALEQRNIKQTQSKNERVIKFKELVKAGDTPNEAKNKVIKEFKLKRSKTAGTPKWMTQGKSELISEGFKFIESKRGPESTGGAERAAKKRKNVLSASNLEDRLKKIKTKTGLGKAYEVAHTANIFQAKKLGIDYPIDALAIQTQNINNKVAEQLNDELKPLYKKQLELVNKLKKNSSSALRTALDNINFKISETVATGGSQGSKAANVLKPIIVDPFNLQGKILDLGFDTTTEVMALPGSKIKDAAVGTTEDIMSRANVVQKLKPFINLVPFGPARKFLKMFAGGGIAKEAGDPSGPPPERGPNPQGLPGLLKRVKNI